MIIIIVTSQLITHISNNDFYMNRKTQRQNWLKLIVTVHNRIKNHK